MVAGAGRGRTVNYGGSPRLFGVQQEQRTSDDLYTPRWIFDRMGLMFDLDVAAPPGGVEWVPAASYYTQADDGLTAPWHGRVWMNPPYSHPGPWTDRFIAHAHGVALVTVSKSAWSQRLWTAAAALVFITKEVEFVVSDDLTGGDKRYRRIFTPLWLAAFGHECVEAIARVGPVRMAATP